MTEKQDKAPFIVGIGHVARVGKDTAAEALCRDLGFVRRSFADPLRELAMKADPLITGGTMARNVGIGRGRFAWAVQSLGYEAAKNSYTEVREFLQRLGVGTREVLGDNVWVKALFDWVVRNEVERLVVPDVRFVNEAEAIQKAGGVVIRINRPGHVAQGHVSETELSNWAGWDREFTNDRWVEHLQADVVEYVKGLLK